jgi:hypothetical protein
LISCIVEAEQNCNKADHDVTDVLPGVLAPVLIENDGPNGEFFSAIEHNLPADLLK